MNVRRLSFLLAFISTVTGIAGAEPTRPTVHIARFARDCVAAISYTFDDGLRDQYTVAVPMLNELEFKGTFFIIPSSVADAAADAERKKNDKQAWGNHYVDRAAKHGCPRP